ncbi:hypothetical protein [Tengunoibacter tsumagoiensis]|uniref:3-keto-disaccharide hydrolase domain-containing protein n=1 Tax=Tengunoibacter tsumagoiensis TaxID=2014871 RepID=A0A402A4L5_9CHLR|nr:hypothetical protein [Tengunoibacter tsumagoiensis]GCE13941.1 hypothetical protein KTT_38000 [Tengunoibacter tsumagoiensis]
MHCNVCGTTLTSEQVVCPTCHTPISISQGLEDFHANAIRSASMPEQADRLAFEQETISTPTNFSLTAEQPLSGAPTLDDQESTIKTPAVEPVSPVAKAPTLITPDEIPPVDEAPNLITPDEVSPVDEAPTLITPDEVPPVDEAPTLITPDEISPVDEAPTLITPDKEIFGAQTFPEEGSFREPVTAFEAQHATASLQEPVATDAELPTLQEAPIPSEQTLAPLDQSRYSSTFIPFVPDKPAASVAYPAPTNAQKIHKPRWSIGLLIALVVGLVALFGESGGVIYYAAATHPAEVRHNVQTFATAHARATDTANQVSTAQAQATTTTKKASVALASIDTDHKTLYTVATQGQPTFNDPINDQAKSNWEIVNESDKSCLFQGKEFHIQINNTNHFYYCANSDIKPMGDFALQVQMKIVSGDGEGLIFRVNNSTNEYYWLSLTQDGFYEFDNVGKSAMTLLQSGPVPQFHTGLGQTNQLTLITQGPEISIYVNQTYVTSIHDTAYIYGDIALMANKYTQNTDVIFSNLQIWAFS